jgi:hypothetical protein
LLFAFALLVAIQLAEGGANSSMNLKGTEPMVQAYVEDNDSTSSFFEKYTMDLKDPNSNVRIAAAEKLGDLKDARAIEPLIQSLGDDNNSVKDEAAWSLVTIGREHPNLTGSSLVKVLKSRDNYVRIYSTWVLGMINYSQATDQLIQTLKDDNQSVRGAAAFALGKVKAIKAVNPLIQALMDEDSEVRGSAAQSLGDLNDTRAVEPLIQSLNDENEDVRSAAKAALKELGWQQSSAQGQMSSPVKSNGSAATNGSGYDGSINKSQFNIETSSSVTESNAALQKIAGYLEAGDIESFNSSLSMNANMLMSGHPNIPVDRAAKIGHAMKSAKRTSVSKDIVFYEAAIDGNDYSFDMAKEGGAWKLDQF